MTTCTNCGSSGKLLDINDRPICSKCYVRLVEQDEVLYQKRAPASIERNNDLRNLYAVTGSIDYYKGAEKDARMDDANALAARCKVPPPFPERLRKPPSLTRSGHRCQDCDKHAEIVTADTCKCAHCYHASEITGFVTLTPAELAQENADLRAEIEVLKERMRNAMAALGY